VQDTELSRKKGSRHKNVGSARKRNSNGSSIITAIADEIKKIQEKSGGEGGLLGGGGGGGHESGNNQEDAVGL